jgi:hypothetical protein
MQIVFEIKGLDKLKSIADKYPRVAEKHVNYAIQRSLVRLFGEEKRQAPFGVSGNLRDRWNISLGRFTGKLTSGVLYSIFVEFGTRPHIVSVTKDFMRWANKKGLNPWAVAKSIQKKGTQANPFFQRSILRTRKGMSDEFHTALKNIINEIRK